MTLEDGRFTPDTQEEILTIMVEDAKVYFGEDINESEESILKQFYRPIAARLAATQEDFGLVLDSAQIDFAEGQALDYLTALIGVTRESETRATGEVTFNRDTAASQDYIIPKLTEVQTDSSDPTRYHTTEKATLTSGTTSVTVPIESQSYGAETNAGPNTVTVMPDPPAGVQSVTNNTDIVGGSDAEPDDELRDRAKQQLGDGSRASASALINAMRKQEDVSSVSIFINDTGTDNTGSGGLPDHSFELVVEGGTDADIGQAILDTKAAGDTAYAGANGTATTVTAELPNGQTHDVDFSRPTKIQIHVSADITTQGDFAGEDAIIDAIVDYIGGIYTTGNNVSGLGVGEDVIWTEVMFAIQSVDGVYDVQNLTIGDSSSTEAASNIAVAVNEVAVADGTDTSIDLTIS